MSVNFHAFTCTYVNNFSQQMQMQSLESTYWIIKNIRVSHAEFILVVCSYDFLVGIVSPVAGHPASLESAVLWEICE